VLSNDVIEQAGRTLADEAAAPAQVFLFGSHARGDAAHDSDLDSWWSSAECSRLRQR
jgi:predicted nucleotidyltransferase